MNFKNDALRIVFLTVFLFISSSTSAQNINEELSEKITAIRDLTNTNFQQAILLSESLLSDIEYYDSYHDKALIYIVAGNIAFANDNAEESLKNVKKALELLEGKNQHHLTFRAKVLLAQTYELNYDYKKAFQLYSKLMNETGFKTRNNEQYFVHKLKRRFAELNYKIGRKKEALHLFIEYREMIELNSISETKTAASQYFKLTIADLYNSFNQKDSAQYYVSQYHAQVKENGATLSADFFHRYEGNLAFYEHDYESAILHYTNFQRLHKQNFNNLDDEIQIRKSRSQYELGLLDSALVSLNLIKQQKKFKNKLPGLNPEYFKVHYDIHTKKMDLDLAEDYLKKYVEAQKRFNEFGLSTLDELHEFENQELKIIQESQTSELQEYISFLWIVIGASILIFVTFILIRQNQNQKKFKALIERGSIDTTKDLDETVISQATQVSVIKDEKVAELIHQISRLNEEGFFLKQKTTLYNTAKKLKTNTSYLSNVINNHLNTNFNAYVNEIRINYIVNELKNNSQMRQYSVKAIAEEIGYKSADSFTKYFKQNTGLSPSLFIKKVNKEY